MDDCQKEQCIAAGFDPTEKVRMPTSSWESKVESENNKNRKEPK